MPKYRYGEIEAEDQIGVVTGLAWTEVGGELLTIEGTMMPGKGRMTVTGNLRDVMKELISAAASYVRSRADHLRHRAAAVRQAGHPRPRSGRGNPEGRTVGGRRHGHGDRLGDDRHPVRRDVAMTGEITLRGRVLPIGGLKEKLLAALRGGIKTVLIPEENAKDLIDISGLGQEQARDHPGVAHGRGDGARAGPQARSHRLGGEADAAAPTVEDDGPGLTAH